MSIKNLIVSAGERYASLTPAELCREAHIFGKMYESCYIAAAKDLVKAANFLNSNDAPFVKVVKAAYTMILPFSATIAENAKELRQEFADEYDSKEKSTNEVINALRERIQELEKQKEDEIEAVMEDEGETPTEVTSTEAVSMADIAAGTVKRGQAHLKPLPFEFRRHAK